MNRDGINATVRQQLLELQRHEQPCLLNLAETIVAVKTVERVDESDTIPVVRIQDPDGTTQDVPLHLIESVDIPNIP